MRKLLWGLTLMFLLTGCVALAEANTIYLPDQSITVRVYGNAVVERTPNTVVYSFTSPQDHEIVWLTASGVVSGDLPGKATATLTEYDQNTETYYVSKVKITVLPRLSDMDYQRDHSANSEAFARYNVVNGNQYPVGTEFSYLFTYQYKGVEYPVTYRSSNADVASIDENGWVTCLSAGTTVLETYCPALQTGMTSFITVYSANTGGAMWGSFLPADPGATAKVYAEPNTASEVLFTFNRNTTSPDGRDLTIHFLAKQEHWSRITCQLGTGWVSNEYYNFLQGKAYEAPSLQEGEKLEGMPTEEDYRTFDIGNTVYASNGEPWIYKKMDRASEILVKLERNEPVTVLAQTDTWLKVRYGSTVGYMSLQEVYNQPREKTPAREVDFPCTMYVFCREDMDMVLFARPGGGQICELPNGTPVTALAYIERDHYDYIQVEVNGKIGYINERYVTEINYNAPAETAPALNIQDALANLQLAAGWSVSIDQKRLDVNLDGAVTLQDAMLILRSVGGEAVCLYE